MSHSDSVWPYYPWYWLDHRANRKAQRLSLAQEGALRRLFDECWKEGHVPSDAPNLAEILGCSTAEVREVWPAIEGFFEDSDEPGYVLNRRLDTLRKKNRRARVAKVKAGRAGGKAKASSQMELLAPAKHVPSTSLNRTEQNRSEQSKPELRTKGDGDSSSEDANGAKIIAAWNGMAELTNAAKVTAVKGQRAAHLRARLREPGWTETAIKAIAFLGSDSWYRAKPSAIRFDVLLRPGQAEIYVERSSVPDIGHAASRGGARVETDRGIHEELAQGRGMLREVADA